MQNQVVKTFSSLSCFMVVVFATWMHWKRNPGPGGCVIFWASTFLLLFRLFKFWQGRPFVVAALAVVVLGSLSNAVVTIANAGHMPVVGMQPTFVPASHLWEAASDHSRLVFLADSSSMGDRSIGDFLLLAGATLLGCMLFSPPILKMKGGFMLRWLQREEGQDIAEYAVMLAVILIIVIGTIRLIGSSANGVFSNVGSALQTEQN